MIGNTFIGVSISIAILTLLDIFLSPTQKSAFETFSIRAWSFLDQMKRHPLVYWWTYPATAWIFISIALICVTAMLWEVSGEDGFQLWVTLPTAYLTIAILLFRITFWLRRETALMIVLDFIATSALIMLGALVAFVLAAVIMDVVSIKPEAPAALVSLLMAVILVWVCTVGVALFPTGAILSATLGLFVLEFAVRRVAEYPKGPLLAISAICGTIAGVGKTFGWP